MNAFGSIRQLLAVEELYSFLKKIIKSMKHQLLMFCIASKLEELEENWYAAPIPENDEHTQGGSKIWASLEAEPSPALSPPRGVSGETVRTGWPKDFSFLFG